MRYSLSGPSPYRPHLFGGGPGRGAASGERRRVPGFKPRLRLVGAGLIFEGGLELPFALEISPNWGAALGVGV